MSWAPYINLLLRDDTPLVAFERPDDATAADLVQQLQGQNFFAALIDIQIEGRDALLDAFARVLPVPGGFERSWAGLNSALRSLDEFIPDTAPGYVFVFTRVMRLRRPDLDAFDNLVQDVGAYWEHESRIFRIVIVTGETA